jgi:LPS O-antigen subunit length determinant protein (WzzB/FepE family)
MTSRNHWSERNSKRSQEKKLHRIELVRKGRRWFKKLLVIIAVVLALAVALSYIFITQEPEPDNLKVSEKGFHGVF